MPSCSSRIADRPNSQTPFASTLIVAAYAVTVFVVALLMSLAALMAFIWAATSGVFNDIERVKHQVLIAEGIAHER